MRAVGVIALFVAAAAACGGSAGMPARAGYAQSESAAVAPGATASADSDDVGDYEGVGSIAANGPAPPSPAPAPATPGQPPPDPTPPAEQAVVQVKPLLIYTATFNLAVFETVAAIDAIEEMARKRGGYLVRRADNFIIVRVPAPQFHEAVSDVGGLGDVLHREITVQDVTAEFRDLELRLRNLMAVRDRVEKLLAQSKNVNEALEVERELERITTGIEQMKGRLKYLAELVAFSTLQVNFQPRPVDQVSSEVKLPFHWLDDLGLPRLLDLSVN
ncbi:MAG TPA: DUF4349 domain-containing protein [Kofleriaceae bacterium]|nr:DUF4349 domain-containing protein [Kofleriaceae bacterium]